ncbi:uncharacterized protein LOC126776601 [Nymphalis io]|uniref:uncharacterized protein LOC126776601 n=1 Tax=Inachis io TaxID=171585 RepID=UPI002168FA77|nr:uncharacterized protein LOC126776601 [Nymphalis io]
MSTVRHQPPYNGTKSLQGDGAALCRSTGLYETVLSLSDSKNRHRVNLEKERSRHAQELVRVERAHIADLQETRRTVVKQLDLARNDISGTLKEAQAVRNWLGYETGEPFRAIYEVREAQKRMEVKIKTTTHTTSELETDKEKWERMEAGITGLQSHIISLGNQLDTLIDDLKKTMSQKLDIMSSEVHALRDAKSKATSPPRPSLGTELAVQEVKETLNSIKKGAKELSKGEKPSMSPLTFAQTAVKPKAPQPSNHTLIISSKDPGETSEIVITKIRTTLDLKITGARVDSVRKARDQKVLSPEAWKRFTQAGKIYVGFGRCSVEDQPPLIQCAKCLGYGHTKQLCRAKGDTCSYCSGDHTGKDCPTKRKAELPAA